MNTAQRRQVLLDIFDKYEEAALLLACLPRSPALWNEEDEEEYERQAKLIERGLLSAQDGFCTTTPAGRDALIAYITNNEQGDEE